MKVSDYIIEFIHLQGVGHVFTVTGAGIMHLTDSLKRHEHLRAIPVHHEQSASMAMDTYARASENFAVGLFTTGPGVTNAITGLAGAWQDSVPCLFVSGQVKRAHSTALSGVAGLRQFGVQELDVIPLVQSLCKYAVSLNDPTSVRYELEQAIYFARSGRPGPVWIDVPMDIQSALIEPASLRSFEIPKQKTVHVTAKELEQIVDEISRAQRPVIVAGQGVRLARAQALLQEFVLKTKIPVVTPYLGIDCLPAEHPANVGTPGIKGVRAANFAIQNSDLLLSIGSSLHVSVTGYDPDKFAPLARKIVVDIDESSHRKKNITIHQLVLSDAKVVLEYLSRELAYQAPKKWIDRYGQWKTKYRYAGSPSREGQVGLYQTLDAISEVAGPEDMIISDTGCALFATSQTFKFRENQRYLPSAAMATMGFSLPGAIGAALGKRSKNGSVLALTGDGSFQQNIQELSVIKSFNLPVKVIILNNGGYASIRHTQAHYFESRYIGEGPESGLSFPDTEIIAQAYDLPYRRITETKNLDLELKTAFKSEGPEIIEVMLDPQEKVLPSLMSRINADGSMSSTGLEDMYPFLDREELQSVMDNL